MVPWTTVWVTLVVSFIVGGLFYVFFSRLRSKHAAVDKYELFETRQFKYSHRSPPPFDQKQNCFGWASAAYHTSDEETLRCLGLDSYMFLRFLRLGFRLALCGTLLGCIILIPVYATGENTGNETEQFNSLTLAHVEPNSPRLWAAALCWYLFVLFLIHELLVEWTLYAPKRYDFLAYGDVDTERDYRYAVVIENLPKECRSNRTLRENLERLFPDKVRQVNVLLQADRLEKLVQERQMVIEALEQAVAFTHAKPLKPAPQVKVGGNKCWGGEKVDAIPHYESEIRRLNEEIDKERTGLHEFADSAHHSVTATSSGIFGMGTSLLGGVMGKKEPPKSKDENKNYEDGFEMVAASNSTGVIVGSDVPPVSVKETEEIEHDGKASSTAFVTFTSLRAKQAAIQCEISGKVDNMDVSPAPIPKGVIWKNALVPTPMRRNATLLAAAFWMTGVLFWAVPVAFVTGIANLNSILQSFGLEPWNENSFWYGLISGMLPVLFLQILMVVLYLCIGACAMYWIRVKSMPEIDAYTFFWHQLYQFANLWLILIGGSIFNQIDALLKDPGQIAELLATALPGASTFFTNMVIMGSFLAFGLELSMIPSYGVNLIMSLLQPETMRTQRMLDAAQNPPTIVWGKILPPMVFVLLVTLVYMPIVPLLEAFCLAYFGGWYLVWKHQCLHVYVQEFEGGGIIWEKLFGFIMACLCKYGCYDTCTKLARSPPTYLDMAEVIVIAYLGLCVSDWNLLNCIDNVVRVLIYLSLAHRRALVLPFSALLQW